jgi:hypothetical protein
MLRHAVTTAAAVLILLYPLAAEPNRTVDFFGIVSADADSNMVKMTEDLYYAQLGEISGLTVNDKRSTGFTQKYVSDGKPDFSEATSPFAFYAVILKSSEHAGKWVCVLNIAESATGRVRSVSKEYDSYYKILMESKSSLQSAFEEYFTNQNSAPDSSYAADGSSGTLPDSPDAVPQVSTDILAGTWSGEEYIDKIVILRGGRGFIIFKNGATMNISVSVDQTSKKVLILQTGKSNASFFPDLPRKTALEAATTAQPVQWNLVLENSSTLSGSRTTLIPQGDGVGQGTRSVKWTRN